MSLLALTAWLVACYLNPLRRLQRHALLNHLIDPKSRWRGRLWESLLSRIHLLLVALTAALLVLMVSVQLRPAEWWVLAASAVIFTLCLPLIRRVVSRHVQSAYIETLSLRLTGWFTIAVTVISLSAVQLLLLEVDDTRSLSFLQVAESAYQLAYARAEAPLVGMLLGVSAALSDLSWHVMQIASSELALATPWKAAAWLLFLTLNAVKVSVLWWVMLGAVTLVQSMQREGVGKAFRASMNPVALLLAVLVLGYFAVQQLDIARLLAWSPQQAAPPEQLHCDANAQGEEEARLEQVARTHMNAEQTELQAAINSQVHAHLNNAFRHAESGIDSFLDWNYSLRGQYTQLFLLGTEVADSGSLTRHLEGRLHALVSQPLREELQLLDAEISSLMQTRLQHFYREHQLLLSQLIQSSDCLSASRDLGGMQSYLDKSWVGMGGAAGVVTAVSLRGGGRVTAQVATRALGRRLATRTATTTTARVGARAAAAGGGGAAGLLCGPAAPLCALGFGAATWVGVDLSINAIDETLNREQMKAELMQRLNVQQEELEAELNGNYAAALAELLNPVYALHEQSFRVVRDGL